MKPKAKALIGWKPSRETAEAEWRDRIGLLMLQREITHREAVEIIKVEQPRLWSRVLMERKALRQR